MSLLSRFRGDKSFRRLPIPVFATGRILFSFPSHPSPDDFREFVFIGASPPPNPLLGLALSEVMLSYT